MARGRSSTPSKVVESASPAVTSESTLSNLESKADTDKVVIVSERRKGKTVFGIEKTPVTFDENGKAGISVKEAKYFLTIPGFELERATGTKKKTESDVKKDSESETEVSETEKE